MIRTQIQLTEALSVQTKQIAAKKHISISELVRRAVTAFIESSSKAIAEDKYERAAAIAGRFSSKNTNTSENHDGYFVEAANS